MKEEEVYALSEVICKNIENLEVFKRAKKIMGYYPIKNEVNILPLIKKYIAEKIFALPKCDIINRNIIPIKLKKLEEVKPAEYGIPIPIKEEILPPQELDLILVPGVIFDMKCYRLGYGYGYYDNFCRNLSAIKVGVAYDFQIINELPKKDLKLDLIVSNKRIIY
jgi:5,10-methenyltetrahydrofolate synthetase